MKEITIITDDRTGLIADVTKVMAAADINIESFDFESVGSLSVINLVVDNYEKALKALAYTEFKAIPEETILVKLEDQPGALAKMAKRFEQAGINLMSTRLIRRTEGIGIVALSCKEKDQARELVKDLLLVPISQPD